MTTLEGRGTNSGDAATAAAAVLPVKDWRLFCCSKRPMRLATLARGLSSGSGLVVVE